jgi:hypothetical protein
LDVFFSEFFVCVLGTEKELSANQQQHVFKENEYRLWVDERGFCSEICVISYINSFPQGTEKHILVNNMIRGTSETKTVVVSTGPPPVVAG